MDPQDSFGLEAARRIRAAVVTEVPRHTLRWWFLALVTVGLLLVAVVVLG